METGDPHFNKAAYASAAGAPIFSTADETAADIFDNDARNARWHMQSLSTRTTGAALPWALVQRHASQRGDSLALVDEFGAGRTWREFAERVEQAAAALVTAGLGSGHVVLFAVDAGANLVELELAVRAVGAAPLHLPASVDGVDLITLLDAIDTRLVVLGRREQLDRLRGCDLSAAELLLLTGSEWEKFLSVGAAALAAQPTLVDLAVEDRGTSWPASLVVSASGEEAGIMRLPEPLVDDSFDVVLLHGASGDPLVSAVRARHLVSGGTLAWTADPAQVPPLLSLLHPTQLVLCSDDFDAIDALLEQGPRGIGHDLAFVRVTPATGRSVRVTRKRNQAEERLRIALGSRLSTIVSTSTPNARLEQLVQALDLDLRLEPPPPMRSVRIPRQKTIDGVALPQRARTEPVDDFRLKTPPAADEAPELVAVPEAEVQGSAHGGPGLPLLGGESFLDRLLAKQAAG